MLELQNHLADVLAQSTADVELSNRQPTSGALGIPIASAEDVQLNDRQPTPRSSSQPPATTQDLEASHKHMTTTESFGTPSAAHDHSAINVPLAQNAYQNITPFCYTPTQPFIHTNNTGTLFHVTRAVNINYNYGGASTPFYVQSPPYSQPPSLTEPAGHPPTHAFPFTEGLLQ